MVALRKESVDRNLNAMQIIIVIVQSLSARRAWIEIKKQEATTMNRPVALRKESVDRNSRVGGSFFCVSGRSPQGERG